MKKGSFTLIAVLMAAALTFGCSGTQASQTTTKTGDSSSPAADTAKKLDWPKDNITVMIGYAPGGGSDTLLSAVRPGLEKELGVTMVPVYKPGSGSDIALTEAARAKKDGYTIVISTTPQIYINPVVRQTQYKTADFQPVANVVTDPGVLVVRADSPIKDFKDLVEKAKAAPGTMTVGVSSAPSDDWFTTLMVEEAASIDVSPVIFTGGDGPSWQAALGGQIDVSANNLGITYPQIKAGKLRVLAIASAERSPFIPDVPTFKELGFEIQNGCSRGFVMPAGTPREVVDAFANALKKVMDTEEFKAHAKEIAFPSDFKGPDEYAALIKQQSVRGTELWNKYSKELSSTPSK